MSWFVSEKSVKHLALVIFCFLALDRRSCPIAYSLLELIFVRSGSFSVSKDFADTDIQTMIDAFCTA